MNFSLSWGGGGVAGAGEKEGLLSPLQAQRGVWLIKLVFANLSLRQCLQINIVHKRYKPRPTIFSKNFTRLAYRKI